MTVADIQMVLQIPFDTPNPSVTVSRQIKRALDTFRIGKTDGERRQRMLEPKLPREFADRTTRQLSGGQKQRLGILRAFAGNACIADADADAEEPVSARDVTVQAAVADFADRHPARADDHTPDHHPQSVDRPLSQRPGDPGPRSQVRRMRAGAPALPISTIRSCRPRSRSRSASIRISAPAWRIARPD